MYAIRSYYGRHAGRGVHHFSDDEPVTAHDHRDYVPVSEARAVKTTILMSLSALFTGRITSYNVCYTKLLRPRVARAGAGGSLRGT